MAASLAIVPAMFFVCDAARLISTQAVTMRVIGGAVMITIKKWLRRFFTIAAVTLGIVTWVCRPNPPKVFVVVSFRVCFLIFVSIWPTTYP